MTYSEPNLATRRAEKGIIQSASVRLLDIGAMLGMAPARPHAGCIETNRRGYYLVSTTNSGRLEPIRSRGTFTQSGVPSEVCQWESNLSHKEARWIIEAALRQQGRHLTLLTWEGESVVPI